jgi:ABC-2 type transport system ATP-binding protein
MITVQSLSKTFSVHQKDAGLKASLIGLFRRRYVEKIALKDVSFSVEAGTIVGLVGANGAGKTTLVKILSGIIKPSSGSATILGFNPWKRPKEFRRQISLVMGQKAQLWWDLPADDCFLLLREIYELPWKDFQETKQQLVSLLNVEKLLKTQVRRLSLGERMKMEIIAALLHRPRVIFLDEPTIGLDVATQRALRDFLKDYVKQYQPAIILTSHYMEDIKALANKILIMRHGQIVYSGLPEELNHAYQAKRTIRFSTQQKMTRSRVAEIFTSEIDLQDVEDYTARLVVNQNETQLVLSTLLAHFPVEDLTIEEEDISFVIERIMAGESVHA